MTLARRAGLAAEELRAGCAEVSEAELAALSQSIAGARRIVTYGCGREGLMLRALAMRLYHLGCDVHCQGDMSCPPLGPGDLLIVSSGPGRLATVAALIGQAHGAGAKVCCITAEPDGPDPRAADQTLVIPVQTMARDQTDATSILPMGSVFEGAMFLIFELLVLDLREKLKESLESMRARHTNLE
ncbi:SIS domain-containing protein [bacterium]|nr:SIS domain-containing protein [bacterium]